jgi:hypothetical protein
VGFEPTITVFERAKTVHALDCAATVIGNIIMMMMIIIIIIIIRTGVAEYSSWAMG